MIVAAIPGRPQPQPRGRVARVGRRLGIRNTPRSIAWKEHAAWHLQLAMRGRALLEGPVAVGLVVVFPLAVSRRRKRPVPRTWCDLDVGDVDNCEKAVFDAANGIVWRDDSQVAVSPTVRLVGAQGEEPRVELAAVEVMSLCPSTLTAEALLSGVLGSWAPADIRVSEA